MPAAPARREVQGSGEYRAYTPRHRDVDETVDLDYPAPAAPAPPPPPRPLPPVPLPPIPLAIESSPVSAETTEVVGESQAPISQPVTPESWLAADWGTTRRPKDPGGTSGDELAKQTRRNRERARERERERERDRDRDRERDSGRIRPPRDDHGYFAAIQRTFTGLRQVSIVNPRSGAGKTVGTLMLGLTFGQARGGFVLTWDNNETDGSLGDRAEFDQPIRTIRDFLRELPRFADGNRIGEVAGFVRTQEEAGFDVLAAADPEFEERLTARAFRNMREVLGAFYKLILVDTGNNVRADNWQAAIDSTDQLVVAMSATDDSPEAANRLLDHLEHIGRKELVRRAVAVIRLPANRKDADPTVIEEHFGQRCRAVFRVPYDRHLDSDGPVRYAQVSAETRKAWLRVAAAIAEGL